MIATVDSFIRIFKFYQDNALSQYFLDRGKGTTGIEDGIYDREHGAKVIDLKTKKYKKISLNDIFKYNTLRYEDTVDIYLNSLVLDKYTQLSYNKDSTTIQTALESREKLKKYFVSVLYPGSYAFNTVDNSSFRRLLLDWTSTIKTIQDSNKRLTDAYSLDSDDIDKALKGFGIEFINGYSLISANRRKNFLLNVCDLYSIKGTPESIVKSLNLIGLENIFIREGWLFEDNEEEDIKLDWQPVKSKSTFNDSNNQYQNDSDEYSEMITTWDWFIKKIQDSSDSDPHWFYTKNDIISLNNNKEVYMKLPSMTPYFGIEYITDADKQIDSLETLYGVLNNQFQRYLNGQDRDSDYKLWLNEYDNKLSILQAYTGLIYALIRFDDHILYENFKSFLTSCKITNIPDFDGKYEYFQLIYWFYRNYALKNKSEYSIIYSFIPIRSQDYCNYEQVLRWWLQSDYIKDEESELNVRYVKAESSENIPGFIKLYWKAPFIFGRYSVQGYNSDDGWFDITTGNYSYCDDMSTIVSTDKVDGFGLNENSFRIVYYHTPANLPDLFFQPPFNLNNQLQDTFLDRTIRYNGPSTTKSFYDDNIIKNAFINKHIPESSITYDVISNYHKNITTSTSVRFCDIDTTMRSTYSSIFKYPNLTRLYEDKWLNINNDFYNFVDWSIKDFTDTKRHEGLLTNNRNMISDSNGIYRKYPVNSKWNWAVDSNYFYYCYESNKWCRLPIIEFTNILPNNLKVSNISYGDRYTFENKLYVYVANEKFAVIDCKDDWNVNDSDILPKCKSIDSLTNKEYWDCGRIKEGSKLSRDLAIAQIKDTYILDLIYKDCTINNNSSEHSDIIKTLNSEEIEVYKNPYTNSVAESYSYDTLLKYLYNTRLILDFSTGYIYPNYQEVMSQRSIYIKCYTDNNVLHKIWVKLDPQFEWSDTKKDGIEATTIYSDWILTKEENPKLGKVIVTEDRKTTYNLGFLMPSYALANRYDSLRFLDSPVFNTPTELQKESDNENIDKSVNYALVKPCTYEDIDIKGVPTIYTLKNPTVFKRVPIMNDSYTGITYRWERCIDNHIYDCNYGIAPDLLEFIESRYAIDDQYYITLINEFTEIINDYMTEELGINEALLDITIANWTTMGIVKKTVNFYKPKRARLLFISNTIEGDYGIGNNLDHLGIGDQDFNYYDLAQYRYGNPEFNLKNLNRMNRTRIRESINDYILHSDTIYKKNDNKNEIYSYREIYQYDTKIPALEVYDQILNLNSQISNGIIASFYVSGLELLTTNSLVNERPNGFYYKIEDEDIYTNNNYFFKKVSFVYTVNSNENSKVKYENRWALFRCDNVDPKQSNCIYVAEYNSDEPFRIVKNGVISSIKYALRDYTNNPNSVNNLDYSKGMFTFEGVVKTNKRTLEPVFYISQFDNAICNGFYYQDDKLYPNRNGKPVYFNQHSKIVTYIENDWIIPFSYNDNKYDKDTKWRLTSDFDFYNNKTLVECNYTVSGQNKIGFGFYNKKKLQLFLFWNDNQNKWIFMDLVNNITRLINCDNKTCELVIKIDESASINAERYARTNKLWIISDNKEIIDLKDTDYFAYCYANDETIWNPRNNDITKVFHKSINKDEDTLTWGIKTSCLYDNENLIDPINGYKKAIYDNYGLYRRNHFNMIELKNKPISYLYCYNHGIKNFYNDNNKIIIETDSSKYSMDKEGNPYGALELSDSNYLKYTNNALLNKDEWSIAFRIMALNQVSLRKILSDNSNLVKPNEWFMVTLTSHIDYDYYLGFVFKKLEDDFNNKINYSKENETVVRQIHFLKSTLMEDIIYPFGLVINETYAKQLMQHFDSITNYQDSLIKRYETEDQIKIRDNLVEELQNAFSTINDVEFDKTELNLHTLLKYTGYVSENKILNCDYCNFYINGKLVRNNFSNNSYLNNLTKDNLKLNDVDIKISEYALWEYPLSDWYCDVISKFRILRSRPEPQKSKTSSSKNNYRPLYVFDQPRIVYPMNILGMPENTNGDRLDVYNADPSNNSDKFPSEVNPLWKHDIPYNENNQFYLKNGVKCSYSRKTVIDGTTLESSSNFRVDTDSLPYWWIKKPYLYSSGPVHSKPVYVAIKEKINEVYPQINNGNEDYQGNYCDIGMSFDGVANKDSSYYNGNELDNSINKNKYYFDITYDPNSTFTSEFNTYMMSPYESDMIIGYAKNKDIEIEKDEEKKSIYEIARNFYPIPPSNKMKYLKLRYVKLNNNGSTYKNKLEDEDIIVPDIAQLTLSKDAMMNGIFHDNLKFYCINPDYSQLIGIWYPSNNVKSFRDGDFSWCYKNENNIEAVLTYQRDSGYFWWEFRENANNEWKIIARTYVQPKHNLSKTMNWKDYINWNQIDLCGQKICKFNETDYTDFATKTWKLIDQQVIDNERRFTCGCWIKFQLDEINEEYKEPVTSRNIYFDGKYIYFLDEVSNKWYRTHEMCDKDWNDNVFDNDVKIDDQANNITIDKTRVSNIVNSDSSGVNGKPKTPSGFLYRKGYLYFYVDIDNRWVRFPITNMITDDLLWSKHYQPWKFYKSRTTKFGYMNVIDSSDSDCFDNCYVIPDSINIIETYEKLIKFNGLSDFEWSNHIGEDILYPKSVDNDISLCRCSIKDSIEVKVYENDSNNEKKLLNDLEASIIRSDKLLRKPDDSSSRSMLNFFEFPLYGKYDNDHVNRTIWQ